MHPLTPATSPVVPPTPSVSPTVIPPPLKKTSLQKWKPSSCPLLQTLDMPQAEGLKDTERQVAQHHAVVYSLLCLPRGMGKRILKSQNQPNKKKPDKKWSRIFKHIAHSLSSVFRAVSSFHLALARLCFMQSFGTATLCKVLNCNAQRHSLVSVGFTGHISDTAVTAWLCSLWNSIASSEAQMIFSMY